MRISYLWHKHGRMKIMSAMLPMLQSELHECQQALRVARVESSRRLKDLQALQKQVSEGEGRDIPEEVLEEERQQREAAQAQLREVKQALNKKNTMVKELRYKVRYIGDLNLSSCWHAVTGHVRLQYGSRAALPGLDGWPAGNEQ